MNSLTLSLTWPIRKLIYKIKMFKKFSPYLVAEWECVECFTHIPFEIFKDFYYNTFVKSKPNHDWEHNENIKKAKKDIDKVYDYLIRLRPDYERKQEIYSRKWAQLHHFKFTPCEDNEKYSIMTSEYDVDKEEEAKEYFKIAGEYEDLITKRDEEYLKKIIEYKGHFWE